MSGPGGPTVTEAGHSGVEGGWRGQRDRGRGADPNLKGERLGEPERGFGGLCLHVKTISQSEHWQAPET